MYIAHEYVYTFVLFSPLFKGSDFSTVKFSAVKSAAAIDELAWGSSDQVIKCPQGISKAGT